MPLGRRLLIFAALAAAYLATMTGNTFESLDGYDYALAAETIAFADTHDTRSILFHKINYILYGMAHAIGIAPRAYGFLRALDCLVAAAAVLLLQRLLTGLYRLPPQTAWLGAALLGVTYGFWRYAGEVEVYVASIALILATLNLIADREQRAERRLFDLAAPAVLGGLAVLYYQPNAIPLFLAMPVLLLSRQGLGRAIAYAATGGAVIAAGLVWAYLARETAPLSLRSMAAFINDRGGEFPAPGLSLWSFGQASLAIAHDLLSTHWLYGIDAVTAWLDRAAPLRIYRFEETIFAARLQRPWVYLPLVVLPALAVVAGLVVWRGRGWTQVRLPTRPILFAIVWFVLHAAVVLPLDPGTEEVWIIALAPIVILIAVGVLQPAVAAGAGNLAIGIIALVAVHNLISGLGIYANGKRDLRSLRSAWFTANARPGDAVLFTELRHLTFAHLRYRHGLDIIHAGPERARTIGIDPRRWIASDLETRIRAVHAQGRRVYVFGDVLEPGRRLAILEGPAVARAAARYAEALKPRAQLVEAGPFGSLYLIAPAPPR